MSFCAVVGLVDRAERPTVKAARRPACLTIDGYATLSRIVSSAVARVRMIVHCAGATPLGQAGATSGVVDTPSSTVVAPAEAGRATHSAITPTMANKERFMLRFNTTSRRQLRRAGAMDATVRCRSIGPGDPDRPARTSLRAWLR